MFTSRPMGVVVRNWHTNNTHPCHNDGRHIERAVLESPPISVDFCIEDCFDFASAQSITVPYRLCSGISLCPLTSDAVSPSYPFPDNDKQAQYHQHPHHQAHILAVLTYENRQVANWRDGNLETFNLSIDRLCLKRSALYVTAYLLTYQLNKSYQQV